MARRTRTGVPKAAADDPAGDSRREIDRMLMEAERIMMQTVQTSPSLIGFGFTITEFFTGATIQGVTVAGRANARQLGESLLMLGLLLLALGLWNQARYRRRLSRELLRMSDGAGALRYRDTPSFVVAVLLLCIGFYAFASVLFRRFF